MSEEHVVFASAIEALARILEPHPEVRAKVAAAGLDLVKQKAAIPRAQWDQAVLIAAKALHPGATTAEAQRQLGRLTIEHYGKGVIGSALFAMLKLIGPMRALGRTRRNFRTSNNYTECKLTERGPREVELWMNENATVAEYTGGVVEAGVAAAGGKNARAVIQKSDAEGTTFVVTWDP
ncbi:MAG: DUF2378 family protein [Myxococcaceae bacterium]